MIELFCTAYVIFTGAFVRACVDELGEMKRDSQPPIARAVKCPPGFDRIHLLARLRALKGHYAQDYCPPEYAASDARYRMFKVNR